MHAKHNTRPVVDNTQNEHTKPIADASKCLFRNIIVAFLLSSCCNGKYYEREANQPTRPNFT